MVRIKVTANDGGWLASCTAADCGWLAWHTRRPAVDHAAHGHMGAHPTKRED